MSVTVCQTKVHFDTEFEANQAAAIIGHQYNEEMVAYPCKWHWHIAHKNPKRRRGAGHRFEKCDDCGELYKISKKRKHNCEMNHEHKR